MPKGDRGGTSKGGTGGVNPGRVRGTSSLVSMRERFPNEVDEALEILSEVSNGFGATVEDMLVAKVNGTTLGYYDAAGNVAINEEYFKNAADLTKTYDASVKSGFHPGRANYSGLQAVLIHELGHRLNYIAGGSTWANLDSSADQMVNAAAKASKMGNRVKQFRAKISGYADKGGNAEAVAEAFADVYMNRSKAKAESRAVYNELLRALGR